MTQSECVLCGSIFSHYTTQPAKYCKCCLTSAKEKTCTTCGCTFSRTGKESLSSFILQDKCQECRKDKPQSFLDEELTLFNEIILGSKDCERFLPSLDVLEESISEACALFRLYFLHTLLIPFNDGTRLEDRLPNTKVYLMDILRRIRNINELLDRTPKQRIRMEMWYNKNKDKTEPTDNDLREIIREQNV